MAVGAVLWKELREQYLRGGRPTVSLVILGVLDLVVCVVVPLFLGAIAHDRATFLMGAATAAGGVQLFTCMGLPLSVVVDAVAGERERHTLETLLASPVRDRDIVLGKALAILLVVGAQAATIGILCMVMWPLFAGGLGFIAAGLLLVGGTIMGLIVASYTTGLGLLVSMHARSVKAGQQVLGYAMMPVFLLPGLFGRRFGSLVAGHPALGIAIVGGGAVLVFVVLNAVFWALAFAHFRRARLLGS
jgi:ABC-2 type transport system permease protein